MRAKNVTRDLMLITNGQIADTWWTRLRGLLGHAPLEPGQGLLLCGEKAIHTIGMSFPIDVLFLDRSGRIVHLMPDLAPLKLSPFIMNANDVLEIKAGQAAQTGTRLGDQIEISIT